MKPVVIAHRGASGYLPEHTLPAKALAVAQGADFLEQDLAMTSDDELIVVHDHFLDRVSDVAQRFPDRARADGRFYVMDFTLAEIRSLRATDGFEIRDGIESPIFPDRFPLWQSRFDFHTFAEELQFVRGINYSMGRNVGIYTEIKAPWLHHQAGKDIAAATYAQLKQYGYDSRDQAVYVQCFDPHETRRMRFELGPQMGVDVPLVQLIAYTKWNETQERQPDGTWTNYDYDWMLEPGGMTRIADYADAIGPDYAMLLEVTPEGARPNGLAAAAHDAGLLVHPFTVRRDQLPAWATDVQQVYDVLLDQVDGFFTDFPDLGRAAVNRRFP